MQKSSFRKDINGLRAIAVIAVVLFHFNSQWLSGGFAGVDVFFVISGFLMTGIIFRGIEANSFNLFEFYVARANRVIPALGALCLALLIFGWFFLVPFDYQILSKHAASSMGFLSNITYWSESGYFDDASHGKWLLHTWSLSVEWQFYIVYPLVLVTMRKFMPVKTMKATVLVGTVLGFIVCVVASYKWPNYAFYLLPTRAWEMMIGGVACLYPFALKEQRKKLLEWFGLALIVGSYFLVSKDNSWPGYLAIFPVLGAFLIIQAQRNNSLVTNNIIFQKLGGWSYSIYLWHWPLVVAIYTFSLHEMYLYLGIALSVFLGFLSNKYIEKIKYKPNFGNLFSYLKFKPLYMVLVLGLLGSYAYISQGVGNRFSLTPKMQETVNQLVMPRRKNGYCFYDFNDKSTVVDKEVGSNCYLGSKINASSTLLFGDSIAGNYDPFFDEVFKGNNGSFQSISTNWCYPSLTNNFTGPKTHISYEQCLINREYLKENMHRFKNIIYAGSWGRVLDVGQIEDVKFVIDKSAKMGVNVIIVAAPHRYNKNPLQGFYRSLYLGSPFDISTFDDDVLTTEANLRLNKFSKEYTNVYFIDRAMLYTKQKTFDLYGLAVPYSLDGVHISMLGSKYAAKHFLNQDNYNEVMNYININ